jgi:hypothetical protein
MDFDLRGRIRNTKLSHAHALLPLFEAIINAIHAVAEARGKGGLIQIKIKRNHTQRVFSGPKDSDLQVQYPVKSFEVTDNGIGFTEIHFKSFGTSDTRQKISQGGKGVGRFLWLKAFDHAEIESDFVNSAGQHQRRSFELRLTDTGIEKATLADCSEQRTGTTVRLLDYKPEYEKQVPRSPETIARRIVEHCLEHFVLGLAPKIVLEDEDSNEKINLNDIFAADVQLSASAVGFVAGNQEFTIHHLRVSPSYENAHRLHFCANNRSVLSDNLTGKIPNLAGILTEQNKPFLYAGYVSSKYLDDIVNSERTDFAVTDQDSLLGEPGWVTIEKKSSEQAARFVEPYTQSVKQAKEEQITNYVQTKAPQFRPLLKHRKELLNAIPPNLSEEKLDLELYRVNQSYEADLRHESTNILSSLQKGPENWVAFERQYDKFLEEWNESGVAKLARHIVHRRATLDFLRASLKMTVNGKYQLESAVHSLIFPLKSSSDDVRSEQMNLWIIDERLAFHYYLASDIRFDQQEIKLPSKDRADIIIFNGPAAFVNQEPPFNSIVIIEFKRPARDDYTDDDNPINQVYRYVELIRSGNAKDHGGRPITIKPEIPFYAYIICDVTKTLRRQANFAGLVPSPDGLGFFGYNTQVGVYIEVIGFDKLMSDAERRNASLFEQLNIPRA